LSCRLVFCNTLGVKLSKSTKIFITIKNCKLLTYYVWLQQKAAVDKETLSNTMLLYYDVGKEGVVTNYQAWLQG
jgi:hypothetical protein